MILGINDGHDAGVALVAPDGEILFAANEERYSGRKQQWGVPTLALDRALAETGVRPHEITDVALGFRGLVETESSSELGRDDVGWTRQLFTAATAAAGPLMATRPVTRLMQVATAALRRNRGTLVRELGTRGLLRSRPRFIAHHEAHAASAYYTCGRPSACVVTLDAGGDGLSGALWHGRDGKLIRLAELPRIHSLGDFWLAITLICGFNPDRHGGKITGLAAYKPSPAALAVMREFYEAVPGRFLFRNRQHLFWKRLVARLAERLAPFDREEISWGAQRLLEELTLHLVREGVRMTGERDVAVAGGIFANVKLNLEILRLPEVTSFFVHPHMGDGGTGLGAALQAAARRHGLQPRKLSHLFFGTPAGRVDSRALEGLKVESLPDRKARARRTAELIADDRVIGLVEGRMEYGPRALCHRSILYHPFDPTVMDWLNARLSRTEFMPFAPVLAASRAVDWFEMAEEADYPARFMTICMPARPRAAQEAPSVVHVDGTARPQLVDAQSNPFMVELLDAFEAETGVPIVINTSFNRHEQPIVATVDQSIEELRRGVVDALVLEDAIVEKPGA